MTQTPRPTAAPDLALGDVVMFARRRLTVESVTVLVRWARSRNATPRPNAHRVVLRDPRTGTRRTVDVERGETLRLVERPAPFVVVNA